MRVRALIAQLLNLKIYSLGNFRERLNETLKWRVSFNGEFAERQTSHINMCTSLETSRLRARCGARAPMRHFRKLIFSAMPHFKERLNETLKWRVSFNGEGLSKNFSFWTASLILYAMFKIKSLQYKDLILNSTGCRKSNRLLRQPIAHQHVRVARNLRPIRRRAAFYASAAEKLYPNRQDLPHRAAPYRRPH